MIHYFQDNKILTIVNLKYDAYHNTKINTSKLNVVTNKTHSSDVIDKLNPINLQMNHNLVQNLFKQFFKS